MRSFATTLVAVASLAGALGASSAQAQGFNVTGFYVGGSLGGSDYKGGAIGGLNTDRSDTGLKIHGGYNFTPNFALEAGYADLGQFHSDAGTVKGDGYFIDGVGKLPVYDKLSVLGRVGVFNGRERTTLAGSDRGTSIKVGAGVQYDLTPKVALLGEWERYRFDTFGSNHNTDLYSVGLNYSF